MAGLLSGINDFLQSDYAGDLGMGLLAQSGPVVGRPAPSFGQAMGSAMQFADQRGYQRDLRQRQREEYERQQRELEEQEERERRLRALLSGEVAAPYKQLQGGLSPENLAQIGYVDEALRMKTSASDLPAKLRVAQAYIDADPETRELMQESWRGREGFDYIDVPMPDGSTIKARFDPETGALYDLNNQPVGQPVRNNKGMIVGVRTGQQLPPLQRPIQGQQPPSRIPGGMGRTPSIEEEERLKMRGRGEVPEAEQQRMGKESVNSTLQNMADAYRTLDEMGAAVNVENSTLENIVNSISASTVGQAIQKRMGTDVQSIRNQIENMKPTLLNHIRKAADMGAKGLDSEKELQFYLRAATDPQNDIQSNMAALEVLDEAYGLGTGIDVADEYKIDLRERYKQEVSPEDENVIDWNAL